MMIDWRKTLISPDDSLGDAIIKIDQGGLQIALVADPQSKLLGVLTDGDVRRALLRGVSLSILVAEVMNSKPLTLLSGSSKEEILAFMKCHVVHHVPVLDREGHLVGLEYLDDLIMPKRRTNWVVLMAGGLGTRLRPLTDNCPKPLLEVGGKPILEKIIESFSQYGFSKIFISVNYKADMIKEYFGDGSRWGVEIQYLIEDQRLGTAGALSLLPEVPCEPFFVMNGDLLTNLNLTNMLDFHVKQKAVSTMAVREYDFQVPYGVVRTLGSSVVALEEKPTQRFFVNAGIYILEPEILNKVPSGEFFDMPSLLNLAVQSGSNCAAFPLREMWIDIGRMEDFERACQVFS